MHEEEIKVIVNKYLSLWADIGQNTWPEPVEPEMADSTQDNQENLQIWHSISSTVTDTDLKDLETQIGHFLPSDYKFFLKYKHFYSLVIGVEFCSHPINKWRSELNKMIFESFTNENLIERGFIPFADYGGIGFLCFDSNRNPGDNNYPIVLWDHEGELENYSENFFELMKKLDRENQ